MKVPNSVIVEAMRAAGVCASCGGVRVCLAPPDTWVIVPMRDRLPLGVELIAFVFPDGLGGSEIYDADDARTAVARVALAEALTAAGWKERLTADLSVESEEAAYFQSLRRVQ